MDELRFGRQFRALRIRLRKRQRDVAGDAGLSRSLVAAVDRGQLDGVTIGSLLAAGKALGADVDLVLRWRGERLDRLLDEDHAAIVDTIVSRLRALRWEVAVEVSFSIWGERGSIDVFGFHPTEGVLVVIEVKSVVPDSQATIHGLDRKTRLTRDIAAERGWPAKSASRILVIGDSSTSRRRIARLASTYDAAFPDRGAVVRRWLRSPRGRLSGLLFVSNDSQGSTHHHARGRERVQRHRQRSKLTESRPDDSQDGG